LNKIVRMNRKYRFPINQDFKILNEMIWMELFFLYTHPRPPETAQPLPMPMTSPVAPHSQAHPAHRHARLSVVTSIAG